MFIETVRLSDQAKGQLIKLKRKTKIENWNVLCRWALCLSLSDPKIPSDTAFKSNSAVEMTWKVFGGEYSDLFEALMKERCHGDGIKLTKDNLAKYFRLHLHRGITYLDNSEDVSNLVSFLNVDVIN